ncbi:MAG TPA: alpha-L-arabinofuranosidase C-terminal domain-containing protein [Pyrinomonadaceae bacterium]|jgi:alpha-N-arabinofuranosidase
MSAIGRREFIAGSLLGGAAILAANLQAQVAQGPDSRVEVLIEEPIGTINPDIYGHFTEHLGGVVYDGIWVGEGSKIPNTGGIRTALVEHMRRIKAPVVRWPGGCFADSYNWRDGVGPRNQRPRRTNFWVDAPEWRNAPDGPWKYDTNHFGTNEFMRFCRLAGAEPYLAANLRSLPAKDTYEWVEYCNSPAGTTTLADLRAAGGDRDPFKVRFWGVGNESWGCGGNFTAEEYAMEFRRFTAWLPRYGVNLALIGSGPNGGDFEWTRRFFNKVAEKGVVNLLYGWGMHHYVWNLSKGQTNDWFAGKGDGLDFGVEEWYESFQQGDTMEPLIRRQWDTMGEIDRQHRVKLIVDEWGAWYKPGTEYHPTHLLGQASTLRDALLAGLSLDTFNRHADKVVMANCAQLINCLHALFIAHEDNFIVTPTFHVFEMYTPHQGAQAVRTVFSAPTVKYTRVGKPASFWGLQGSASLRDKELVLTAVNPHVSEPRDTEIVVQGARIRRGRARVLSSNDIHAHNTFEQPRALEPRDADVNVQGGKLVFRFPPASVTSLRLTLG